MSTGESASPAPEDPAFRPRETRVKTLGIIGGTAPESTIEYYRLVIRAYRERQPDGSYPPILINSIDLKRMLDLVGAGRRDELIRYLLDEIGKLARAGADLGLLAANTPHIVFDDLRRDSPMPLVSIVEAACEETRRLGLSRVGLFGTKFTMEGRFYPDLFSRHGIALSVPAAEDRAYLHDTYMGELVHGVFLPKTRARLLEIVDRLREKEGIQGLILGGTELPLILGDDVERGIPFLDTTRIHVARAITEMLS